MNPLIVPVAAIIGTCWTIVTIYRLKNERLKTAKSNTADDEEIKTLKLDIIALKERIEVLETIVTDKNYDLKREIDQL